MNDEDEHIITNKQEDNAIILFLGGLGIALAILLSACARGCQPEPVYVADSICEQCGEIITAADRGQCFSHRGKECTEVAYGSKR
jgi:hypothetical protein